MILTETQIETQYSMMTEENKNETGSYVPDFEALIEEAPNAEMKAKWAQCRDLIEETKGKDFSFDGFAYSNVYMMKMKCGDYEIFQTPGRSEEELVGWIKLMQSDKHYKKCTSCICNFR